jgi:hypothetical protein
MKEIYKNKILNIPNTDNWENIFLFSYLHTIFESSEREVFFMWDRLKKKENSELLSQMWDRYAMYNNVYSSKDEFEIFQELWEYAFLSNKKIHIVWITLDEEVKMLEKYYEQLWFIREDINCFKVDFSVPLITVSVHIENIMWRGSDYKQKKSSIFFLPPIREAWQTKAMYKGINRGVISSIYIKNWNKEILSFITQTVLQEHILVLTLWKVFLYNLLDMWYQGEIKKFEVSY